MAKFTGQERAYLRMQEFGRIATSGADLHPHVTPVNYELDLESGSIIIPGLDPRSKKVRDLIANPRAGFVVDDIVSLEPFVARGVTIRGDVEIHLDGGEHHPEGDGGSWLRLRPKRVVSWGLDDQPLEFEHEEGPVELERVRGNFGYNRWAMSKILSAAENLSEEQFVLADDTPFGSVRNQLVHILDAQQGWIEIADASLRGVERDGTDFVFEDCPDIAAVQHLWMQVEATTDRFLDTITVEDLNRTIDATFPWGNMTSPLWVVLTHIVAHGTQHRSETAMKLTNSGHSPGMVDFIFYWVEDVEPREW
jgi:PPOX class F420-dependent enzyme/OxyR family protein